MMRVIIVTGTHELAMELGLQEPVLEIKWRMEQMLGIPMSSQTLSIHGWELVDGLDMTDYPIVTEGTKIDLTVECSNFHIAQREEFQIIIKFLASQIHVNVERTETVGSLKEKIHIISGTPIKGMMLFFSGIEMAEDCRNLSEYGVYLHSEIVISLKSMAHINEKPVARMLSIVIKASSALLNGASIPMNVEASSTVDELRQLLLNSEILPMDDYLFIHKQRIMRNNCSLHWHGVENEDYVYVFYGTVTKGKF